MKKSWILSAALLLVISAIAYLPLVGQLGFYGDDWHVIWGGRLLGPEEIIRQHLDDRPLEGVEWAAAYSVLGDQPLVWHLFTYLLRLGGGLVLLWVLRMVWPDQPKAVLAAAVLFVIYPGFMRLPQGMTIHPHLLAFLAGMLSIALNIRLLTVPGSRLQRIALGLLAVLLGVSCYFLMEWMVGMEGIRLILIGTVLFRRQGLTQRAKIMGALRAWAPNLLGFCAFLAWRVFIFKSARAATNVGDLGTKYLANPFEMLIRLLVETSKDFFESVVLGWVVPFYQFTNRSSYERILPALALAFLGVGALALFGWWARRGGVFTEAGVSHGQGSSDQSATNRDLVVVGALIALVSLLPVIASYRDVVFQDTYDRYTLLASVGSALILVGLGKVFLSDRQQAISLGVLVGIAVVVHYHNTAYHGEYWKYQREMWWQLSWRAPSIKPYTTLIADPPAGYPLAEGYEIWGPANLIYQPESGPVYLSGEALNDNTVIAMLKRDNYGRVMRRVAYTVDFKNALVLSYPGNGACLHIVDGDHPEYSASMDPKVRLIAGISRIETIDLRAGQRIPPVEIFGKEPEHDWCFYYQKASLARQAGDWTQITRLADEVKRLGLAPVETSEWMPFYEAYVRLWRLEEANFLGGVLRANPAFQGLYCVDSQRNPVPVEQRPTHEKFMTKNLCE